VGVQGAKATDFQQIEQVIMDTLRRVCDTGAGLTRERIDSFLHQVRYSLIMFLLA
jgi:Zn-dependent M16 (insulinase) family peptidase